MGFRDGGIGILISNVLERFRHRQYRVYVWTVFIPDTDFSTDFNHSKRTLFEPLYD